MAATHVFATTGGALLPDIGECSYNGVKWTCLYTSKVSGRAIKDAAGWTVKFMEWTIYVEGVITLVEGASTIDATMTTLRRLLNAQAGVLTYSGKGFGPLVVNLRGGPIQDVAWGPVPETLEFTPLGASASAMVRWTITTRIPEVFTASLVSGTPTSGAPGPVLQFNNETSISYDENAYSTISYKGTLEVPLTRTSAASRAVARTVDDFRQRYLNLVAAGVGGGVGVGGTGVDLSRFRVVRRAFNYSRDQRTAEWEYTVEELPPMGMPPGATTAHGTFSVRPIKPGYSIVRWHCTLRGTYTIRKDFPRRLAWLAFVSLLKFRMEQSKFASIPATDGTSGTDVLAAVLVTPTRIVLSAGGDAGPALLDLYKAFMNRKSAAVKTKVDAATLITNFGFDEGIHLDSKTITFEASWRLITDISAILKATGVWLDGGLSEKSTWAIAMKNIMGWRGNLINEINPASLAIIDVGGGSTT